MSLPYILPETSALHYAQSKDEVLSYAKQLKAYGGVECEREEKERRELRLKSIILHGIHLPFQWCVGRISADDVARRVNGQHSSEVFLNLTDEDWEQVRFPVPICWQEYHCDNAIDLAYLFEQFDPHWSSRSLEDKMGVHLAVYSDLLGQVETAVATRVTTGLVWYRQTVSGHKASDGAQFGLIHEDPAIREFLRWCGTFLKLRKTPEMFNKPVIGALYHTALLNKEHEPERVKTFWKEVALGAPNSPPESVEYKLAEFIAAAQNSATEWPATIRRQFHGNKQRPSDKDVFATCLRAASSLFRRTVIEQIFVASKRRSAADLVEAYFPIG